jgi:hypothetical protein
MGVAFTEMPEGREDDLVVLSDPKSRFLRALNFLILTDAKPSYAKAARVTGLSRGTVGSWLHRNPDLRAAAESMMHHAERSLANMDATVAAVAARRRAGEPMYSDDLVERVEQLPPEEIARIAVGAAPSREFMQAAFPLDVGEDGQSIDPPAWLSAFPAA